MKRFEFELQTVLTLRQCAEQEALAAYGSAIQSHPLQLRIEERKMLDDLLSRRPPVSLSGRSPSENAWN